MRNNINYKSYFKNKSLNVKCNDRLQGKNDCRNYSIRDNADVNIINNINIIGNQDNRKYYNLTGKNSLFNDKHLSISIDKVEVNITNSNVRIGNNYKSKRNGRKIVITILIILLNCLMLYLK